MGGDVTFEPPMILEVYPYTGCDDFYELRALCRLCDWVEEAGAVHRSSVESSRCRLEALHRLHTATACTGTKWVET